MIMGEITWPDMVDGFSACPEMVGVQWVSGRCSSMRNSF